MRHSIAHSSSRETEQAFSSGKQDWNLMTAHDYRHELIRKSLEGSLREYMKGIRPKVTLEWALGVANYALKSGVSADEVKGILMMVELGASDAERKRRLDQLRDRLGWSCPAS
jgi:hypothetical protein